jgi:hypothetical protein
MVRLKIEVFFGDTIRSDFAKWGKLARDIGFTPR